MEHTAVYNTQAWRELPRSHCVVDLLLGGHAGPCRGTIHHHHVNPDDPWSRTLQVCASHHPKLHAALRSLERPRRRCTHSHRYDWARRECERRLNNS